MPVPGSQLVPLPRRQGGSAFIISMVMLLVLAMMAITATRVANSDLLMTNSFEHENEAFVAAENSLRVGERLILNDFQGAPTVDFEEKGDGYYSAGDIVIDSPDWDQINYETGDVSGTQYVIEYIGPSNVSGGSLAIGAGTATSRQFVYRVVGRGASSQGSVRLTESIVTAIE